MEYVSHKNAIRAWHFVGDRLRDGKPVPGDGEWIKFDGDPVLCEQGLHASIDAFDALRYAPGRGEKDVEGARGGKRSERSGEHFAVDSGSGHGISGYVGDLDGYEDKWEKIVDDGLEDDAEYGA